MRTPKQQKDASGIQLEDFKTWTTAHPKIKEANASLMRLIQEPGGASIIFIVGPSGAGKTTLYGKAQPLLEAMFQDIANPGCIPVGAFEAPAPSTGQFNWSHNNLECLKALKDPITLRNHAKEGLFGVSFSAKERRSELELQLSVESALKHRRTKILLIDEAHHMAIISGGRRLKDQTEFIKSMCNMNEVIYVLFGTYDLLQLFNLNGQLANRSALVHFPRYDARKTVEREQFQNILLTFQEKLPFAEKPNLETNWEFMYERSIGCVGTLKLWLNRAVQLAVDSQATSVSMEHVEKTALSVNQCIRTAKDAIKGEEFFLETEEKLEELHALLGLNCDPTPPPPAQNGKRSRGKNRPGECNPKRVKVGNGA
jgi:hypothetical protein